MAARQSRAASTTPLPLARRRPRTEPAPAVSPGRSRESFGLASRHPYRGAVLLTALMGGLTAVTWGASTELLQAAGTALDWLAGHNTDRGRALATVLCGTVGALTLVGAWARETAERRPVQLAGGRARMAVDEVATALRDAVLVDVGLADADVRVQNLHRRGLRVTVRADVRPQARIDETIDGVDAAVREVVQGRLGARLAARPTVDVRYQELDLRLGRDT